MNTIISAFNKFQTDLTSTEADFDIAPITSGLLHKTFCLTHLPNHKKYIIQQLRSVFDFSALNYNLKLFEKAQSRSLKKLPQNWQKVNYLNIRNSNDKIYQDKDDNCWRAMEFVDGQVFSNLDNLPPKERQNLAYSLGQALAIFGQIVNSIPVTKWQEPLPHFHDTAYHYNYLHSILNHKEVTLSLSQNPSLKVKLQNQLFTENRKRITSLLGKIEKRKSLITSDSKLGAAITHGDPKINNLIFRKNNSNLWQCVCLIDLDTVQPGETLDDLGDALRSIGNLGNENPPDINSVTIDKPTVETVISGYFGQVTPTLRKSALTSYAKFLYMLSIRFLADYLVGSIYFSVYSEQRPDLNLYRAEVQMETLEKLEYIDSL